MEVAIISEVPVEPIQISIDSCISARDAGHSGAEHAASPVGLHESEPPNHRRRRSQPSLVAAYRHHSRVGESSLLRRMHKERNCDLKYIDYSSLNVH